MEGWCGRTLWFDKLCLQQSLDAKPIGGAPCKGESGEGNAARIYPSFSATNKKGTHRVPFFGFDGIGGVDEPSGSTNSAFGRV